VIFDPSSEPDFRGALSIEIKGFETGDRVAFKTSVALEVRSRPEETTVGDGGAASRGALP
jgi:hypothetical protein